jgi:hypothetical protein
VQGLPPFAPFEREAARFAGLVDAPPMRPSAAAALWMSVLAVFVFMVLLGGWGLGLCA